MQNNRRQFLIAAQASLLSLAAADLAFAETAPEQKKLRTLKLGVGSQVLTPEHLAYLLGEGLGYNAQEGFHIEFLPLGSVTNVLLALANGSIDIGVTSSANVMPLYAKGQMPPIISFFEQTYPYKFDIAVSADSPIKSYADLKGRKMGVSEFGGSTYFVTRKALENNGVHPDTDIQSWVPVGTGLSGGQALRSGLIEGLADFDTGFGAMEAAGIPFRLLPRPASLPMIGGLFLSVTKKTLATDKSIPVGFARSMAKSCDFVLANVPAAVKVFLGLYPELAIRGASMERSITAISYQVNRRKAVFHPPYPNTKVGFISEDELRRDAQFLGLKITDFSPLYTNDLIDEINDFDVEAIKRQATQYPA